MYKSAHDDFFNFILKSHLHDPKINLNKDSRSENHADSKKQLETPTKNSKIFIDENTHTSNKYKKQNRKLSFNEEDYSFTKNEVSKTTNELIKELAQTVKEGQSLQKDVEVLKKVVLEQNYKPGLCYNIPNTFRMLEVPQPAFDTSQLTFLYSNGRNENKSIEPSNIEQKNKECSISTNSSNNLISSSIPVFSMNSFLHLNDSQSKYLFKKEINQVNITKIFKKIRNVYNMQELIRKLFQQLKIEVISHFEKGSELVGKLSGEVNILNVIRSEQDSKLKEKKILIAKLNDSIDILKINNKELTDKCNIIKEEKELVEKEMNRQLLEIEEENIKLKVSAERMESKYEQVISELKKNNSDSQELSKLISQFKNMGIFEKTDESKYIITQEEKKSLNQELTFLKDILKDKRDQEEQLHKNIVLLSEKNSKLESNHLELKSSFEKKTRENSILQSIVENYKIIIRELEEKNTLLQSEAKIWEEKLKTEIENLRNTKENMLILESEANGYKRELETKSLELSASLSRLGQVYVELNETKQTLKEIKIENESLNLKVKSLKKENQELNDALSSQFQFNRKKDLEIESIKKESDAILKELEQKKLLVKELREKISELEVNYSKVENERCEAYKELNNKYIIEMEKTESLDKISRECQELRDKLELKENEVNSIKKELEIIKERSEKISNNEIKSIKAELIEKHQQELNALKERKNIVKIENENLIQEVTQQKKMIQDLLFEKIALNNEITSLKETLEIDKLQFENSMKMLTKELTMIQELGFTPGLEEKGIKEVEELINGKTSKYTKNLFINQGNNLPPLQLHKVLQSTTAPCSSYSVTRSENIDSNKLTNDLPFFKDLDQVDIENPIHEKEASLSAQCEMAYIDILAQTERFKTLSQKLKYLEEILRKNDEETISEILEINSKGLEKIGIFKNQLLKEINSEFMTKNEIDQELSKKLTEISQKWVTEAENSRYILENAHESRNIAAKTRMSVLEKKYQI